MTGDTDISPSPTSAPSVAKRPTWVRSGRVGAAPGTLFFQEGAQPTTLRLIAYGPEEWDDVELASLDDLDSLEPGRAVRWLDVVGLGSEDVIRALGARFGLHNLMLEDLVNTQQRAKVEEYESGLFTVVRMPMPLPGRVMSEQVSMILTGDYLITVQEREGDVFEPVRERIRVPRGTIRQRKADYLLYALIDAVVDAYFPVLEELGVRLDALEEDVMGDPDDRTVTELHALRRQLVGVRRAIWPHRDMLNALLRDADRFIEPATAVFLRDAYDHAIQIIDLADSMRDVASDLLGAYMSVVSNRMNEVMKALTIIAMLFIPPTFVAGLYGMNFDTSSPWNMPELGLRYGYIGALGIMAAITIFLVVRFRRRGWL